MGQGVTSRINAAGGGSPCRVLTARGALLVGAAGGADDLLTFRRTLGSPTSRGTLVVVGEFGTRFGTGAARPVATEGLSGTSLNGVLCCFVVCCCTPQGREKPTGTGAPSYGSEGWGFESLSERAKVLVTGLQMSV